MIIIQVCVTKAYLVIRNLSLMILFESQENCFKNNFTIVLRIVKEIGYNLSYYLKS